jgi:hypothetical protein
MVYLHTKSVIGNILEAIGMENDAIFLEFLRPLGPFYDLLVYFVLIWYIFTVLVCCTDKKPATLYPIWYVTPRKIRQPYS